MESKDRIKRWIAFYLSVTLFLVLLPIVLSYSLGYNIDFRRFKIYKTGIIYLKSQPAGASIYINGKEITDLTPARIEELKPDRYNVEVRREGFYPWHKELVVMPNMVTKAEDIVLFRLSQDITRIKDGEALHFAIPDKKTVYYMAVSGLFRMNLDGTNLKKLSSYCDWPREIKDAVFSPDGDKFLYFNREGIWVVYLKSDTSAKEGELAGVEEVLKSREPIQNVFWYSQSNYIVFVTSKDINVIELSGQGIRNTIALYKFNASPGSLYYDTTNDSLYFTDLNKEPDAAFKRSYLYRLDLRQKFFTQLMQRFRKEFEIRYEKR